MVAVTPPSQALPNDQLVQLSGISWQTYEALLTELIDRRLRLSYHHGQLEIMTPSPEHEVYKETLGRMVETLAEELAIKILPWGSTTLKRLQKSGAEPDKCFYISNIDRVRGHKRLDLTIDPAPDLVLEIDITSGSQGRLPIYAELGVAEVWCYDGHALQIYRLVAGSYGVVTSSLHFPTVPIGELTSFLVQVPGTDYLDLIRSFRQWVRTLPPADPSIIRLI
jgi:Uma2 family endonuclease